MTISGQFTEIEMEKNIAGNLFWIAALTIVLASATTQAQLQLGFYHRSCPKAESLIREFVQDHIPNAPSLAAALLRMHFHDCFVQVIY